jgi:phosphonate transport system permease protein
MNEEHKKFEKHLRPQWSWKTFIFITSGILLITFVTIDLEINFITLFTDSFKYFYDIFSRMLPPDFSNFTKLIFSMIETIEIAILGTFIAIILSIPLALLSAKNIAPNVVVYLIAKTITVFFRAIPEFIIAMYSYYGFFSKILCRGYRAY